MKTTGANASIVEFYLNLLSGLSAEVKLDLISKLSASLKTDFGKRSLRQRRRRAFLTFTELLNLIFLLRKWLT
ncbi:MAG: hypothetical protein HY842_15720 [Bacteroidetes bacterium]|nr:hypothetical protein [Bacteroidota bacterium]